MRFSIPFFGRSQPASTQVAPAPHVEAAQPTPPAQVAVVDAPAAPLPVAVRASRRPLSTIEARPAQRNVERFLRAYVAGSAHLVSLAAGQVERALTGAAGTVGGSLLVAQPEGTDVAAFARSLASACGGKAIVVDNSAPLAAQLQQSAIVAARGTKIPLTIVVGKLDSGDAAEAWSKLVRRNVPGDIDLSRCLVIGYFDAPATAPVGVKDLPATPPATGESTALTLIDAARAAVTHGNMSNPHLVHWQYVAIATPDTKADIYEAFNVACRHLRDRLEDCVGIGDDVASSGTAIRMTRRAKDALIDTLEVRTCADAMAAVGALVEPPLVDHLTARRIGHGERVIVDVVKGQIDFQVLRDDTLKIGLAHTSGLLSAHQFKDPNDVITWALGRPSIGAGEALDVLRRMPQSTEMRRQDSCQAHARSFVEIIGSINPEYEAPNDTMAMLVILTRLGPCDSATAERIARATQRIFERHKPEKNFPLVAMKRIAEAIRA